MSYEKSYANSPCPNTDAVEDIKSWLGDKWEIISSHMATLSNQNHFAFAASFVGVQGFPVKAWYELYHGEGSWKVEDDQ
jgi:hypothetical protein